MSQEIEIYNRIQNPVEAAAQLGLAFAKSGMFGCDRPEQGTILALACLAENKTPFDIVREYDIVDGKLRKKALAIFAEFRQRGGKVEWIKTGKDGKEAKAKFTFDGQTLEESFTIEEAQKQNIVRAGSAWVKTPANMLRARVLSNAIAMLCPEILAGASGLPEDDNEQTPQEPKQIFANTATQQPAPTQTAATVASTAPVIDIAPAEPAPTTPPPAPQPVVIQVDPKTKRLTVESVQAVEAAIGEANAAKALKWMEHKQWIPPMGGILNLSAERARKIVSNPTGFAEQLDKWTPEAKA